MVAMGKIAAILKAGAVSGALVFLSDLMAFLHSQFVEGSAADDETKKGLATFALWYPELKQAAARTDTNFDDQMIAEVMQFAESVLPATYISEARGLYGPEDSASESADPAVEGLQTPVG